MVNVGILPQEPGIFMLDFAEIGIIVIMFALAMTATAVSLTMVSLRSEGLHKTRAATTSAVLDDIASLALVAVLVPMASGQAMISLAGIGLVVLVPLAIRWWKPYFLRSIDDARP